MTIGDIVDLVLVLGFGLLMLLYNIVLLFGTIYAFYKGWEIGKWLKSLLFFEYFIGFLLGSGQLYQMRFDEPVTEEISKTFGFIALFFLYKFLRTALSKEKKESVRVKIIENTPNP